MSPVKDPRPNKVMTCRLYVCSIFSRSGATFCRSASVVITVPTDAERQKVVLLLENIEHTYSLHVMTLFGLGSFTGDTAETQKVLSLMYQQPYNVYGTPENAELEELMTEVESREADVWASMTTEERRAAIQGEIENQRASGRQDFGNCWQE